MSKTYELVEEDTGIVCLKCGMVSYTKEDVRRRYCPRCNIYHDEVAKQEAEAEVEQDGQGGVQEPTGLKKREKKAPTPAMSIVTKLGARKYTGMRGRGAGSNFTRRRLF